MNKDDILLLSFITVWIILCAGEPDVLDGITRYLMTPTCEINIGVDK